MKGLAEVFVHSAEHMAKSKSKILRKAEEMEKKLEQESKNVKSRTPKKKRPTSFNNTEEFEAWAEEFKDFEYKGG